MITSTGYTTTPEQLAPFIGKIVTITVTRQNGLEKRGIGVVSSVTSDNGRSTTTRLRVMTVNFNGGGAIDWFDQDKVEISELGEKPVDDDEPDTTGSTVTVLTVPTDGGFLIGRLTGRQFISQPDGETLDAIATFLGRNLDPTSRAVADGTEHQTIWTVTMAEPDNDKSMVTYFSREVDGGLLVTEDIELPGEPLPYVNILAAIAQLRGVTPMAVDFEDGGVIIRNGQKWSIWHVAA